MPKRRGMRVHNSDASVSADCAQLELLLLTCLKRAIQRGCGVSFRFSRHYHAEILTQQNRTREPAIDFSALIHPRESSINIDGVNLVGGEIREACEKGAILAALFFHFTELRNVSCYYNATIWAICVLTKVGNNADL